MATAAKTAQPELYAGMPQGWTVQDSEAKNWGAGDQNLVTGGGTGLGTSGALTGANENNFITDCGIDVALAVAGANVLVAGTLAMTKLIFDEEQLVSNAWYNVTTVGVTPTHGFFGLVDVGGNLWANSADQLSTMFTTTGVQATAYTTPVIVPAGTYWQVELTVGGTAAKLASAGVVGAGSNANLTAGSYRFGTFGSVTAVSVSAFQALFPLVMANQVVDNSLQVWAAAS